MMFYNQFASMGLKRPSCGLVPLQIFGVLSLGTISAERLRRFYGMVWKRKILLRPTGWIQPQPASKLDKAVYLWSVWIFVEHLKTLRE